MTPAPALVDYRTRYVTSATAPLEYLGLAAVTKGFTAPGICSRGQSPF